MSEVSRCGNEEQASPQTDRPVIAARVLFAPPPFVPDVMLRAGEPDLSIELLFTIAADGSATPEILKSSGYSVVDAATLDAAIRWRFAPATLGGCAVQSFLRTRLTFTAEE